MTAPATESVADTSATWATVTTTLADCLILFVIATGFDTASTTNMGALSGGTGLGAFTERLDAGTSSGTGSWIGLAEALKSAAGATGGPGATLGSTDGKALLTVALAPEPAAATGIPGAGDRRDDDADLGCPPTASPAAP